MDPFTRALTGGMIAASMLATARPARAANPETRVLVVQVENYAHVSPPVLDSAEALAVEIYKAAGVRIVWLDSASVTDSKVPTVHARVLLLSREMTDAVVKADRVADNVLGQAQRVAGRAMVFWPRLLEIASARMVFTADLLGRVMAHEIGHLLLSSGHATCGIMQEGLQVNLHGPQRFTAAQAVALHAGLEPIP